MKIAGIVLVWVGVMALLKNLEIITVINWNVIWPFLLIIVGSSLKHCRSMMHGAMCKGGNCGMCAGGKRGMGGNSEHKCEGPECKH